MVDVKAGYTFDTNEAITATKLNDLVDKASLSGMGNAELDSSIRLELVTAPASPASGDVWPESNYDYIWLMGASSAPVACAFPFVNGNATVTIHAGWVVVIDPENPGQVNIGTMTYTSPDMRTIGVAMERINPGDSGLIQTSGEATCLVFNTSSVADSGFTAFVGASTFTAGAATIVAVYESSTFNPPTIFHRAFAHLQENVSKSSNQTARIRIIH